MTELDHSSVTSLLADLDRHRRRGGVFRFKYRDDGTTTLSWRLKSATIVEMGVVHIRVGYADGSEYEYSLRLAHGWLFYSGIVPMTVVLEEGGQPRGSSDSDASQRDQLDKNLRGVFA